MCSDPNGNPITYSLMAGKPDKDYHCKRHLLLYSRTSDTGVWGPRIIAKDPQGLADTLLINLTVSPATPTNHKPMLDDNRTAQPSKPARSAR